MIKFLILVILLVLFPGHTAKAEPWSYADKQEFQMKCFSKVRSYPGVASNYTEEETAWTCSCVQLYFENTYTIEEFAQKMQNYSVEDGEETKAVTVQCILTMRQLGGPNAI